MPDLGPFVGALAEALMPALSAFLKTTAGMVLFGSLSAVGCFWIAAEGSTLRGLLAAVLALAVFGVLGVMLAAKRAVARAIEVGVGKVGLGNKALNLVFSRLLGVDDAATMGERGGQVAKAVERMPLAQAETALRTAVQNTITAPEAGGASGFLKRLVQKRLFAMVEKVTLARFREEGTEKGGVDLSLVREELASKVDELIGRQLRGAVQRITLIIIVGAVAGASLLALGIRQLPI